MHYKFEFTSCDGKRIEFTCTPEFTVHKWKNFIQTMTDEIGTTLDSRKCILDIVEIVVQCTMTNTICKLEVEKIIDEE